MKEKGLENLIRDLVAEFESGIDLIERIDPSEYTRCSMRSGSVGAQFRHNLDFLNSFLNGIQNGMIDYELRERDPRVETDKAYATRRFVAVIERLQLLEDENPERVVKIRSEIDPGTLHSSSLSRELEFLLSHTVHHHALIAEILERSAVAIAREFGVAPSTLKYWRQERINSAAA